MTRPRSTLLLALAATVALAGCGGSERVSYERDLAEVGGVVDEALEQLPEDDSTTLGPAEVRGLADELREAADQLADLDPPSDAEAAQARLERGLRGIATAFDDLAGQLGAADTDAEKSELFVTFATDEQVDTAFDDVIGAQEAYADKGYRVFGSTPPKGDDG